MHTFGAKRKVWIANPRKKMATPSVQREKESSGVGNKR
jgi:hypothetical protein